ncbi:MAG: hypothetical protein KDK30_14845 [Leptospiraceae bacterium]|nr:hypothetical protein [Leptospiraceae bacterium]
MCAYRGGHQEQNGCFAFPPVKMAGNYVLYLQGHRSICQYLIGTVLFFLVYARDLSNKQVDMDKMALEIRAPLEMDSIFALPTLHILLEKLSDGTWAGHCLDFDTWAYSENEDEKEAISRVTLRLLEMAFIDFIHLHQADELNRLYDNEVDDPELWKEFRSIANRIRTQRLSKSLHNLLKDTTNLSEFQNAEIKEYDFSEFSDSEKKQVQHWLQELQNADPDKRNEILLAMVKSLARVVPLRLAV